MLVLHSDTEPGQGHEAGRRLLRQGCRQLGLEPMPEICRNRWGKPYFPGNPLYFSITHTAHHAFCVLSKAPVGVDAEEKGRRISLRLADKILSPGERERYDRAEDKSRALLRLWVLKEAALKLEGTGLRGYPCHTDFDPEDGRIREQEGCYLAVLTEKEKE